MSRIYGNIEEVDSEKIKKFFNNRAKKDEEALLVKTDKCDSYLGIDYSEDLIEIAKENYNYDNCHFQVLSASQLDTADLLVSAPL